MGSYAEYALVPAAQLVKLPAHLEFSTAAAAMLQGMTAHYLSHSTYPLKAGDTALVHAGAGGVGLLLTQMAARLGAQGGKAVTPAKTAAARANRTSAIAAASGRYAHSSGRGACGITQYATPT